MRASRGHRLVEHTADVIVEAWAPTWQECLEEAVLGFVSVFAEPDGATAAARESFETSVPAGPMPDRLLRVLDDVLLNLDTQGLVPVAAQVEDTGEPDAPAAITLGCVDASFVEVTGAIPKAVSRSDLSFEPIDVGQGETAWRCRFTVDV